MSRQSGPGSKVKILKCTCDCEYQDKKYGKGRRVHNRMNASKKKKKYRCTGCAKERRV